MNRDDVQVLLEQLARVPAASRARIEKFARAVPPTELARAIGTIVSTARCARPIERAPIVDRLLHLAAKHFRVELTALDVVLLRGLILGHTQEVEKVPCRGRLS